MRRRLKEIKRCPRLSELPAPPKGRYGWPWTEESIPLPEHDSWPRVSIVTPSYNQGQYLEETIRSVVLQGYPDLEYIIIDGGSSDNSVDIIRKYEPWLTYWVSEPDRGQTHAINKGWGMATGEILAYINSDDCYLEGAVTAAAEAFLANPEAALVYGTALIVDATGKPLRTWSGKPFDVKTMLNDGNIVPQPTAFFSGKILQAVGFLEEKWNTIMDYELYLRIGQRYPTVCLPLTLASFRDHSQSKSNLHFETIANELLSLLSAFSPDQMPPREVQRIKRNTQSRIHFEWALATLAHQSNQPLDALKQLLMCLVPNPLFALKDPLGCAYIIKEVFLREIAKTFRRFSVGSNEKGLSA